MDQPLKSSTVTSLALVECLAFLAAIAVVILFSGS